MIDRKLNLITGERFDGFEVKTITPILEMNLVAIQLLHLGSGAKLLHLYNDDAENLFSINLPTPPTNDTGLPHIMEHSVLSGSKKYPVREPFFEMYKMSMATFINAMTGWDCTYYPVASNVKQDLFNLAEVYFDAVFYPLLTEQTFKREAHHLVPVDKNQPDEDLTINGIVYNEMKGNFSDPESKLYRQMFRSLFPDTIYGNESGGDPESIPDLTYDDFMQFHQTFYHPSNAYIFIYGNIPTKEYLEFLKDKLNTFQKTEISALIEKQPRWSQPKKIMDTYPVGKDESTVEKTYVTMNWLVGDGTDAVDVASLYILSNILLGNEAAPLKKAIIDSKLGKDLIYSGFSSVGLETTFGVGLKGTEFDHSDAFVNLVLEILENISKNEISRERIEAAFQQTSYHYREILPSYPIYLMERVLGSWIYGADPLTFVRMNNHLAFCRETYESDQFYFNKLIRERILENNHRLIFVLKPDREWQVRTDKKFLQKVKQIKSRLSNDQLKSIAKQAEELERISGTPNSEEALAQLPQLKISDLPEKPEHIPTIVEKLEKDVDFLHNDVFSNGVNYLTLNFDLKGLPVDLWEILPRYKDAVQKLGAAGMNYEEIARRISTYTGGINCSSFLTTHASDPQKSVWGLKISLKTLNEQIENALRLLKDILFGVDPRDRDRLYDVLIQAGARYQTQLVHDGSKTASRHASRGLSLEGHLSEIINGLPQLALTEKYKSQFDNLNVDLMEKIERIRDFLLTPHRLTVSFTGTDQAYEIVRKTLSEWIGAMRDEPVQKVPIDFIHYQTPPREGLAGPMQVAYCVQVLPAPHYSDQENTHITLGTRIISLDYFLNEIRFKGNAYGAWCNYSALDKEVEFGSYRDPHIARTLNVFNSVLDYVSRSDWTQTDIDRAIIGTAKNYEKPIRPEEATENALHRHVTGQTSEIREKRFEELLSATAKNVKKSTIEYLELNLNSGAVCVVSSREKLEEANRQMSVQPLTIQDIL